MAAMSMTEGGLVVVGVSDGRVIEGVPLDQMAFDRIARAAPACTIDVAAFTDPAWVNVVLHDRSFRALQGPPRSRRPRWWRALPAL